MVKGGEIIGEDLLGTIPHTLVLCNGSTLDSVQAFDDVIDPDVNRVALIDTFNDEKFECLKVAEALVKNCTRSVLTLLPPVVGIFFTFSGKVDGNLT